MRKKVTMKKKATMKKKVMTKVAIDSMNLNCSLCFAIISFMLLCVCCSFMKLCG